MSAKWPLIRRRCYSSGLVSYQVDLGLINGKRERETFKTKEEAESYAEQARIKRQNEGLSAFTMRQELRVDALQASRLLEPHGVTLAECARYYAEHVLAFKSAPVIPEIVARLLKESQMNQRRKRTIEDLRCRLKSFATDFPQHRLTELTVEDIKEWICDEDWKARTRNNYLTKISQLFKFGIAHGWAHRNPVELILRSSVQDGEPGILTVEQAQNLLEHAPAHGLLPYVALSLFCGLRSAELLRLDWRGVQFENRAVIVAGDVAKRRSRRSVDMPDVLLNWLRFATVPRQGPVVDKSKFRKALENLRESSGLSHWPHNCLRHSFGSYHLAMHGDAVKTSFLMGNSPDIVHNHYKAIVLKPDAERFWNLKPKTVLLEHEAEQGELAA